MGKLVSDVYTAERKPRGSERGREGMNNCRQPPAHPRGAEFEMMTAVQGTSGAPGSLSGGSTLTFRARLPELAIPEPPEPSSLLPSFNCGQGTKDCLGMVWVQSFCFFVLHVRAIQTPAKCTAVFRKDRVETHQG